MCFFLYRTDCIQQVVWCAEGSCGSEPGCSTIVSDDLLAWTLAHERAAWCYGHHLVPAGSTWCYRQGARPGRVGCMHSNLRCLSTPRGEKHRLQVRGEPMMDQDRPTAGLS